MTKNRKNRGRPTDGKPQAGRDARGTPRQTATGTAATDAAPRIPGPAPAAAKTRSREARAAGGNRFWLAGTHPVLAALSNPERRCGRLLATENASHGFTDLADTRGIAIEIVSRDDLDRLTGPDTVHQGVALDVLPLEPPALSDLPDALPGCPVLVLDQVTDPRNVGAILRSAAVFGAIAVVVQDRNAPPETAVMAKAASGALESVPMIRVSNLARALEELKQSGYWVIGFADDAPVALEAVDRDRPLALVMGAEGDGMRRLTREACDQLARISMAPNSVGSLNVSNAAAVALYAATLPANGR